MDHLAGHRPRGVPADQSYDELEQRFACTILPERGVALMRDGIGMSLRDLYDERKPLYEQYADITVDVERPVHHRRRPQGRRLR